MDTLSAASKPSQVLAVSQQLGDTRSLAKRGAAHPEDAAASPTELHLNAVLSVLAESWGWPGRRFLQPDGSRGRRHGVAVIPSPVDVTQRCRDPGEAGQNPALVRNRGRRTREGRRESGCLVVVSSHCRAHAARGSVGVRRRDVVAVSAPGCWSGKRAAMNRRARLVVLGITLGLGLSLALAPLAGAGAATRPQLAGAPGLPQTLSARQAAQWLAAQLSPQGWMPTSPGSNTPSLSFTANTILALVAADVDPSGVQTALSYLEANVDAYVTQVGADGPGQLALLILDADAGGVNPTSFGGTNLVSRLLATEQPSGLFGTDTQLANFDAGNYEQGLALAALGVAGVKGPARLGPAIDYLESQQCPDGGWSFTAQATDTCVVSAVDFTGPDTNSTAAAVQGLAAQGAITPAISASAVSFYTAGQDADGGWSFYPSSPGYPQSTDPNSTALVIQALIALGQSPTGAAFAHGVANPVAALLTFQLTSGADAGAFQTAFAPGSPDILASYQATPAVAGASFAIPLGSSNGSYWLVGSNGGVTPANAIFHGSLPALGFTVSDVVGMAGTPDGGGYWAVAADGGVFAFGSAPFEGSMGGKPLYRPVVGMASTSDGGGLLGWWRPTAGSSPSGTPASTDPWAGSVLNSPIVGIAATPDGGGYWDGGGRRRGLRLRVRQLRGLAARSRRHRPRHRGHRRHALRAGGYWDGGGRRRGLRLRVRALQWIDGWSAAQPTGQRYGRDPRRRGVLGSGS